MTSLSPKDKPTDAMIEAGVKELRRNGFVSDPEYTVRRILIAALTVHNVAGVLTDELERQGVAYGALDVPALARAITAMTTASPPGKTDADIMRELRPSRETLERIRRLEEANASGDVRNMLIGSDTASPITSDADGEPDHVALMAEGRKMWALAVATLEPAAVGLLQGLNDDEQDVMIGAVLGAADRLTAQPDTELVDHIREQAKWAETRIQDGKEMGATVWRIALEDIVKESRALLLERGEPK